MNLESSPFPAPSLGSGAGGIFANRTGWGGRGEFHPSFSAAIQLSPLQNFLNSRAASQAFQGELRALVSERDPELFAEGLLALGGRAETAGDLEFAARLYGVAANEGSPDSIRSRAQERLNAMTGTGATGPRAEFLLRQLSREVLDPAPLTGMVAASAVFRMTRLAALAHSWRPVSANLFAFGAEAAMFPLGSRLAASALGRELDWNPALVGREIGSSFILLGAMRLSGSLGRVLYPPAGARPALQGMVLQGSMLGGIMLAHQVETAIGLRPHLDGATTLIDSLALLFQFHVAGRLVHPWLGRGATYLESRSQLRPSELFGLNPISRPYRFPSLALEGPGRGPILAMVQGSGNGGEGNGGSGPRVRRPTLLGLGPEGPRPASPPRPKEAPSQPPTPEPGRSPTPPVPTRPSKPIMAQPARVITTQPPPPRPTPTITRIGSATQYPLEGLPPETIAFRISGIANNPVVKVAELIEAQMRREPVSSLFEAQMDLDPRLQGQLRIEIHRIFRELNLKPGTLIVIAMPKESSAVGTALLYSFREGNLTVIPVSLGRPRPPTQPPSPSQPQIPTPPIPPARSSTGSGHNTAPGPVTHPGIEGSQGGIVCKNLYEIRQAVSRYLENPSAAGSKSVAFQLLKGRMGFRELEGFAYEMAAHPLPDGHKLTIFWSESGGGRLSIQRQGDRLLAQIKGFRQGEQGYLLFPQEFHRNQLLVFPEGALRDFSFRSWSGYEQDMEAFFQSAARLFQHGVPSSFNDARLEGSTLRGHRLSLLAQNLLKLWPHRVLHPSLPLESAWVELNRHLERAYAVLDFDALAHFQEHLGREKLRDYETVLAQVNAGLEARGEMALLAPARLPLPEAERLALPGREHLRELFLEQLFQTSGGKRSALEALALISDPARLGRVAALSFRSRMGAFVTKRSRIPMLLKGGNLAELLQEPNLSPQARELRAELEALMQDMDQFYHLFFEGSGNTSRAYLNEVFNGEAGIAMLYRQIQGEWSQLSLEYLQAHTLRPLVPEDRIQQFLSGGRRPQSQNP